MRKILKIGINKRRKNLYTLYYSIKGLELLGTFDSDLKREIRDKLLFQYNFKIKNIWIENNIAKIYYYLGIAEIVMEGNKGDIKNLLPDLEKGIGEHFISYLKKNKTERWHGQNTI